MTKHGTGDVIAFLVIAVVLIPAGILPWFQDGDSGFAEPYGQLPAVSVVIALALALVAAAYRRASPRQPWKLFDVTVGQMVLALGLVPFALTMFKLMAVDINSTAPSSGLYLTLVMTALVAYHGYLLWWDEQQAGAAPGAEDPRQQTEDQRLQTTVDLGAGTHDAGDPTADTRPIHRAQEDMP